MAVITLAAPMPESTADQEVSLTRLYVLRATYLLLIVGLGGFIVPQLLSHEPLARGVIPSLLGAVWLLDFGLTQWSTGNAPATFPEDFKAIVAGVILMPIVIPWGHVQRHFARQPGARWR
ncbi:MAG: hypothetical protein ABI810_10765 [Sphingomonas bacterium]